MKYVINYMDGDKVKTRVITADLLRITDNDVMLISDQYDGPEVIVFFLDRGRLISYWPILVEGGHV
jgi:hypothetical protein